MSLSVKAQEFKDLTESQGRAWDETFNVRSDSWHERQLAYWRSRPRHYDDRRKSLCSPHNGPTMYHTNGGRHVLTEKADQ